MGKPSVYVVIGGSNATDNVFTDPVSSAKLTFCERVPLTNCKRSPESGARPFLVMTPTISRIGCSNAAAGGIEPCRAIDGSPLMYGASGSVMP